MSVPTCSYKNKRIVIELKHDALSHATDINETFYNHELDKGQYQVTDSALFAKEVVNYLNEEDEEGNTLVTRMFDQAISLAIENGAEGIEDIDEPEEGGDGEEATK